MNFCLLSLDFIMAASTLKFKGFFRFIKSYSQTKCHRFIYLLYNTLSRFLIIKLKARLQ